MLGTLNSLVRYMWAAPASAVGLVLLLVARAAGATVAPLDGTLEVGGGRIALFIARLPQFMRFNAITFGHVILGIDHDVLAQCRTHERVHVRQYERWGVLFFPLYLGSSLVELLRGRNPYWNNYFERQAYEQARTISESAAESGRRPHCDRG